MPSWLAGGRKRILDDPETLEERLTLIGDAGSITLESVTQSHAFFPPGECSHSLYLG